MHTDCEAVLSVRQAQDPASHIRSRAELHARLAGAQILFLPHECTCSCMYMHIHTDVHARAHMARMHGWHQRSVCICHRAHCKPPYTPHRTYRRHHTHRTAHTAGTTRTVCTTCTAHTAYTHTRTYTHVLAHKLALALMAQHLAGTLSSKFSASVGAKNLVDISHITDVDAAQRINSHSIAVTVDCGGKDI